MYNFFLGLLTIWSTLFVKIEKFVTAEIKGNCY